ncbi:MAG TPA: hypothetical protein VJX73_06270 [Terracidiphilus sp.]|nr:hypothetical protein [Terracidiphilus sp.]
MKRLVVLSGLLLAFGCGLHAQAAAPVDVKVCDVVKSPASFDGKMVRIKGTVVAGFDEFIIKDATDPNCGYQVNGIWLSYPQGSKAKSGPVAIVTAQPAHNFAGTLKTPTRTPVTLDKSKDFKQFDSLLAQPHQKGADMCLGCARYEVTATLVGRLDTVADASIKRDASGKITGFGGFGNMNAYPARLVLASVSEVSPKEIDYSKTDAITKGDSVLTPPPGSGGGQFDDPFAAAARIASHVAAGPAADQTQKAIAQFPKGKEQNGVSVVHGVGNEVTPDGQGTKDSPDGVLYNCVLNPDRLQGSSMVIALFHVGQHVADLRSPKPDSADAPFLINENDAWVVTSIAAIVGGQKYLTLPGGYLFWNIAWPAAQRDDMMEAALKDFLSNEALLSR